MAMGASPYRVVGKILEWEHCLLTFWMRGEEKSGCRNHRSNGPRYAAEERFTLHLNIGLGCLRSRESLYKRGHHMMLIRHLPKDRQAPCEGETASLAWGSRCKRETRLADAGAADGHTSQSHGGQTAAEQREGSELVQVAAAPSAARLGSRLRLSAAFLVGLSGCSADDHREAHLPQLQRGQPAQPGSGAWLLFS